MIMQIEKGSERVKSERCWEKKGINQNKVIVQPFIEKEREGEGKKGKERERDSTHKGEWESERGRDGKNDRGRNIDKLK